MRPAFALAALLLASPAAAADRVIDGDSLVIDGTKIRLQGIDAPEKRQACGSPAWPCGKRATERLLELIRQGGGVTCRGAKRDRYKRLLATCTTQAGQDVARVLVAEGLALNYDRYGSKYKDVERQAKAARRGMWGGRFVEPWVWRKAKRSK